MANHKSALKRAKQSEIKRTRNKAVKTRVKNIVKEVRAAVSEQSSETAADKLKQAQMIIDTASKSSAVHKKTAARKISRLTKLVNTLQA